jgi:phosphoribosylamine--glycine ligase
MKAAVVGKDGRTSAVVDSLEKSGRLRDRVRYLSSGKLGTTAESREKARAELRQKAKEFRPDFVVIGPEEPLADGWVDILQNELRIPCIGPTRRLSQLEASKSYTRELLQKHNIPGNPAFRAFKDSAGIELYLESLGQFAIKPDGLTGGKGVKVSDVHLFSVREALAYCEELFREGHQAVVIEEKLDGEEFSLQSFADGLTVKHMPIVQDHKRVGIGDTGPNTGGMGSYSWNDGSLPFLTQEDVESAQAINADVIKALHDDEVGEAYKGILYGGFIATRNGIRLIEYNVRFGDPEALNVLSLLQTDFVDICEAIIHQKLAGLEIAFSKQSTVCKYIVPDGYPDSPAKNAEVDLSRLPKASESLRIFEAAIEGREGKKFLTGSRAIALVGIADQIDLAEKIAEEAARSIGGPVYHRPDIGSRELIQSKIDHMDRLRKAKVQSSALIQ